MSYQPLTFEQLREELLAETRNQSNGARITPDTEEYQRASVAALAAAHIMYALKYVERQIFPGSADWDNLRRHGANWDLEPKSATIATDGQVQLTGTDGTVVGSGLTLTHEDGTEYRTTSGGTVAGGALAVSYDAVDATSAPNRAVNDELTLQSPPVGLDQVATVTEEFAEPGTDDESQEQFLARLLARMREGNQGGTHTDYEQWALAVDGCYFAHCLPGRRGSGTVSVAVYTDVGGFRRPAGPTLQAAVLAAVEARRPVCAEVDVPTITEVAVDVAISMLLVEAGFDPEEVAANVILAVREYIWSLETGQPLYLSQLGRVIASVAGVRDYQIDTPTDTTEPGLDASTVEVLIPGAITASAA